MRKDYSEYICQQFGELTILSISESRNNSQFVRKCKCKCSCGKEIEVDLNNVVRGRTRSCGHIRSRARKDYSEYINKQFGELTILSISNAVSDTKSRKTRRYCECKCSCGKRVTVRLDKVTSLHTRSCGHLQDDCRQLVFQQRMITRNLNPNCFSTNKSTGIKNISFSKRDNLYRVSVMRNHIRHEGYTSSLAEAIKIKERILQELGELD